jgi:ubiquinone/menaquinone biosynthesis C-methylase UbiE
MAFNEDEMQALALLFAAENDSGSADHAGLDKASEERYWIYKEDLSAALPALLEQGLIEGDQNCYRLTDEGRPKAQYFNAARSNYLYYHYYHFWQAAFDSKAHTQLCERAFGKDLCQDGMVDMAALEDVIAGLNISPGKRLFDLGCGVGMISEHISDVTGASVVGLDYAPEAVKAALDRTVEKRNRLDFVQGDMNDLNLEPASFDVAMSLDTLYWAVDLEATVAKLAEVVKPGGQICIFMMQGPWDNDPSGKVPAEGTNLGQVLAKLGLRYEAHDYTEQNKAFWKRNYQAAVELLDAFRAEGNEFIALSLIKESEEEFLPAIEADKMTRYLYQIWP